MRFASLVLVACGTAAPPPAKPVGNSAPTCSEAAVGLEHATRGVRAPESTVLAAMRARCGDDMWPVVAIECFAKMREGELGRCAKSLPEEARGHMFSELAGGATDRTAIAIARARLEVLQVGVGECDRFVAAVAVVLTCEQMPIEARVELGNETASFWDLPTSGLPADAQARMAAACGDSLAQLRQQAQDAGCML